VTSSVIGIDTKTGQRVHIPKPSRLQGLYIIGIPGTGKSGLIENLIIDDIKQGTGVAVLDPHGDLINNVLARMDRREDDVLLLDITDYHYPFGLNLFACSDLTNPIEVQKTVDQVMHVFEKLYGVSRDTPLILDYLRNCTYTLIANPGYTMAEIPLLLLNEKCRRKLVANVDDIDVRHFWQQYEQMKPNEQNEQAAYIRRRVSEFLLPLSRPIVGQSTSTIDMQSIMNEGKILLVKLSTQLPSVTTLIGSMLIALILNAASARPANKRRQFHLYADEFQNFATEDFAKLLEEARKFGIGTTIAHQNRAQLETSDKQAEAKLRARALSAANLVVFKVNSKDGDELAGEFDITPAPERIEEIEKEELIGQRAFRTYKRDVVGHLLRQGHEDERVMAFVRDYLQEFGLASQKQVREEDRKWGAARDPKPPYGRKYGRYLVSNQGILYDPDTLPRVLVDVNTWLFEGMREQDALWQPLPVPTLGWFADFFGFGLIFDAFYGEMLGRQPWERPLTKYDEIKKEHKIVFDSAIFVQTAVTAVEDALIDFVATQQPQSGVRQVWLQKEIALADESVAAIQARGRDALSRITGALQSFAATQPALDCALYERLFLAELSEPELALDVFLPVVLHAESNVSPRLYDCTISRNAPVFLNGRIETKTAETYDLELYKLTLYQGIVEQLPSYLKLFPAFLRFFSQLHCAQLALSQRPIETMDSGQYEPDKRTQTHYIMHSQRPYQDMLKQVASELVNQDNFMARVRIKNADERLVECTIKTLDPKQQPDRPLFGQALHERLVRIKEQNIQDGYVRERATVEAEIRTRQAQCSEPPQEPPDAIYRRQPH
jgi:hypothetical protein